MSSGLDREGQLRFVLQLPAHPVSASLARAVVRHLHDRFTDDQFSRAETIVSELVTNAIRHGSGTAAGPGLGAGGAAVAAVAGAGGGGAQQVALEITFADGAVHGCVRDHGPVFGLPTQPPRLDQTGGFGLHIVGQLTTQLAVSRSPGGNVVTFSI